MDNQNENISFWQKGALAQQSHDPFKGSGRWNDIAEKRSASAETQQEFQQRNSQKSEHYDLDITHADHKAIGKPTNKQADKRRHKRRKQDQSQHE